MPKRNKAMIFLIINKDKCYIRREKREVKKVIDSGIFYYIYVFRNYYFKREYAIT